jgi:hypothetical protein
MASPLVSRAFPGFDHVYWFSEGRTGFRGELDWPEGDTIPQWRGLTRGEVRPPRPIPVRYAQGRGMPADVIWTTNAFPFVVHKRVIDLLLDHRFTGWGTYPVELYGREGEPLPDYLGFAFTGRCGPIDGGRSEKVMKPRPLVVGPVWIGVYFDEKTWDGSDFFTTSEQKGWTFVTEDVVKAFKKAGIKGVSFEKLSAMELLYDPCK